MWVDTDRHFRASWARRTRARDILEALLVDGEREEAVRRGRVLRHVKLAIAVDFCKGSLCSKEPGDVAWAWLHMVRYFDYDERYDENIGTHDDGPNAKNRGGGRGPYWLGSRTFQR